MQQVVEAQDLMVEGDAGFTRVDNKRPPNMLEPGCAADAQNYRFDSGKATARYGVSWERWGTPGVDMIAASGQTVWNGALRLTDVPLVAGQQYFFWPNGQAALLNGPGTQPNITLPGLFTAQLAGVGLFPVGNQGTKPIAAQILRIGRPLGYSRFTAPDGTDNTVLVTADWRDQAGEDGGYGRAWRIYPGSGPQLIAMNGHDAWDTVRLVPSYNALLMLRGGSNERHYFKAASVSASSGQIRITLNCVPGWNNGDLVQFFNFPITSFIGGTMPPQQGGQYYVCDPAQTGALGTPATTTSICLYQDKACTQPLMITTSSPAPTGTFYLQRIALSPGPYGNGAPSLILQGVQGSTPFSVGWKAAPLAVAITATASNIITAPGHRLLQGDPIVVTGVTDGSSGSGAALPSPVYAVPLSPDTFQVYSTQVLALGAQGTYWNPSGATGQVAANGLIQLHSSTQTGSLVKQTASGVPMPPAREGIYFLQRNFLVNQFNSILISDPLDPLHYTQLSGELTGNLGENQEIQLLQPLGVDTLLIVLPNSILALFNLSGAPSVWNLREVTRQYGMLAPLAGLRVGTDVWGFGRKGVISVNKTEFGELSGVDIPVSDPIPKYIEQVDWTAANLACAENWDNRSFFAVALKGQTGAKVNNAVLVFNGLNKFLAITQEAMNGQIVGGVVVTGEQPYAWEGMWTGALLTPIDFARVIIYGEERLTFVNASGIVCWFSDDFTDMGAAINTSLTPRAYWGGGTVLGLSALVNWDTFNPQINVTFATASYNETQAAAVNLTYDRTAYLVYVASSDTNFANPFRQDYSMVPDLGLYTAGVPFDVHQNITEKFRVRLRDRNIQLTIANGQGSCRINSVTVRAAAVGMTASSNT